MFQRISSLTEEDFKRIARSRKIPIPTIDEQIVLLEMLRKETQAKTQPNGGRADCQRIVGEEELPNLLAEGWRVAAVLPSGKVVVESNGNCARMHSTG